MKPWTLSTADRRFAQWIRDRDQKCQRCGSRNQLTCSHFIRRNVFALRYDPKNCICLCLSCHMEWEKDKRGEYQTFMEQRIGATAMFSMCYIAKNTIMKKREAIAKCREFLDGQYRVGGTE